MSSLRWNVLGAALVVATSCSPSEPRPSASQDPPATSSAQASSRCPADGLGPLMNEPTYDPSCLRDDTCKERCARGEWDACMAHGYALQRAEVVDEADALFARACQLGSALGCTNFAAALWIRHDTRPGAEDCARQLFVRACDVGEPHACGMLGRMMATSARTDAERIAARNHFARVCRELGGSTCRMFAHHLESGQLGPYPPELIRALLYQGCKTGDNDACGRDTATETFR